MTMSEKGGNPIINGGTFIAESNTGLNLKSSIVNDIVDILHSRSAPAGLLDTAKRFETPKRDEGTRVSVLRGMRNFVQQDGPAAVLWLRGPAGSGKSALAQSLALSLNDKGDHAASFLFSRTSPGRNDGNQLIVTLACQLALSIPTIKPLLAKAVEENPLIFDATNAIKMQRLIVDPINQLQLEMSRWNPRLWARRVRGRQLHPRLILVDGLDECDDPQVQEDLLHCIALAVRQLSLPFRFIIASRPESHILATFELDPIFQGPDGVKVSIKNLGDGEDADEQITKFLLKEFAEIRRTHPLQKLLPKPWPVPGQIARLVSRSSQEFIYSATVIRYIKMSNNRPDDCLERILGLPESPIRYKSYQESLDVLYHYIFESVPDVNKKAVQNIFQFLVPPNDFGGLVDITPRVIEHYFNYEPGHVQHVLCDLLCVVSVTAIDDPIKVLHGSLGNFLLDPSRSGPLYIGRGDDVHAIIAASFPLALRTVNTSYLPDFRFVEYLEHIMESNFSNTLVYRRLVDVDFGSRYIDTCDAQLSYIHNRQGKLFRLFDVDIEGIAFVAAYLLVLLIKNAQKADIRRHITEIEAYILRKHPFAASLHAVRHELFPAMIPLFREWTSSIDHDYIRYIFEFRVPHSKSEIREEIFELYFLMSATFFGHTAVDEFHSQNVYPQPRTQQMVDYSNHISLKLLEFLSRDYRGSSVMSLKILAVDLVEVSLAHAGYSTSLTNLLFDLLHCIPGFEMDTRRYLRRLAPGVTDYLERVYSKAPMESQQEILELSDEWKQYLNKQNN